MDKIYKIPKHNNELYLGGTLMKDLKIFIKSKRRNDLLQHFLGLASV